MKVYAVYSIPKSPEYRLEKLFSTKEAAKNYIKTQKHSSFHTLKISNIVYDIQLEEVEG